MDKLEIYDITVLKTDGTYVRLTGTWELYIKFISIHEYHKVDDEWKSSQTSYMFNWNFIDEIRRRRISG